MTTAEGIHSEPTGMSSLPRRVLICEDDPAIRAMLGAILSRTQFEVVSACDGAETLTRLDDPFDVIVLDLMMPTKSGYDVLDHLQTTNPTLLRRTIVVTANAAVTRQPLQVPVAAVFVKPFDIVDFTTAVRRVAGDSPSAACDRTQK
jgi:two-component system response regulator VicR